jgi:hypothetical protein
MKSADTPLSAYMFWLFVISAVATAKSMPKTQKLYGMNPLQAFKYAFEQILRLLKIYGIMLFVVGGALLAIVGFGVAVWQCVQWLQIAEWPRVNMIDALHYVTSDPWLDYPQTWLGIHKALSSIPAFIGVTISGALVFGIGVGILDQYNEGNET